MATRPTNIGFTTTTSPTTGSNIEGPVALSGAPSETAFDTTFVSPRFGPPTAPPRQATIQALPGGHHFVYPLFIVVQQEDGDSWSAQSDDLGLVGQGPSDLEAIDDLRSQLAELFGTLMELRDELGPLLREQLSFLERLSGDK